EAQNRLGYAVNAIEFSCLCHQADDLLLGLLAVLKEAARRQLSGTRPGMLCAFIPGITDFRGLERNSAIANMTGMLFDDKRHDHIAAVGYSSGARLSSRSDVIGNYPALIFKNPNCRFPEASQFRFLDEPIVT
ncbi:MAG TPA: hypothetical protein VLV32_03675, partial [Burkholderiales bacterium]|nr:hypothetical protein [Burkholderiales bacterium]